MDENVYKNMKWKERFRWKENGVWIKSHKNGCQCFVLRIPEGDVGWFGWKSKKKIRKKALKYATDWICAKHKLWNEWIVWDNL